MQIYQPSAKFAGLCGLYGGGGVRGGGVTKEMLPQVPEFSQSDP